MTNKLKIDRELLTILADLNCPYDQLMAAKQRAAEILAAPVVERQPAAIVNRKAVCFLELTEAGHLLPCGTKLYAEQPAPVAVVPLLAKGFTTLESIGGKYKIVTGFENRDDAWAAYDELCRATSGITKVKELNQ